jgi:ParB-like chromosome segregation protein Spo0J
MAQALIRRSLSGVPKAAKPVEAKTEVGTLRMVRLDEIKIPEGRFRKNKGDLDALARSIAETGLVQPIVLDLDLVLISGERRYDAHVLLGREEILARIVNFEDPLMAAVEEDRCRKALLPSELYDITETIKQRMKDEAWSRRAMGGRLSAEVERGRADDFLSAYVGISRPTLAKIRDIVEAADKASEKFSDLKEAMDQDGKVDRHHKELKRRQEECAETVKFPMILLTGDWTDLLNSKMPLSKIVKEAKLARFSTNETIFTVTTPIETCSQAAELVRIAGFRWQATVPVERDTIRLVASKTPMQFNEEMEALLADSDDGLAARAASAHVLVLRLGAMFSTE